MYRYAYILLSLVGCAAGSTLPIEAEAGPDASAPKQYKREEKANPKWEPTERDGCVPDRFASDNIPPGYRIDPDCPPMIYDPAQWIPPWDPGPVIKEKSYETNGM